MTKEEIYKMTPLEYFRYLKRNEPPLVKFWKRLFGL